MRHGEGWGEVGPQAGRSTHQWNVFQPLLKPKTPHLKKEIVNPSGQGLLVWYRDPVTLLSFTGKRWVIREPDPAGGSVIERLLKHRGLEALGDGELLETFGHDARRFRDFTKAADRIGKAIEAQEKIGIFGDYDCDGITSTALLARFFHRRNLQPMLRLPHRVNEGYGLQSSIVEEFKKAGVTLLLTVDTGATAVKPIAEARTAGMDVIVLDHHRLPDVLPDTVALLHPELALPVMDDAPCGAGVAWSVIHALEMAEGRAEWEDRDTDIALAAIGTVADLVELRGGNRTLAHRGLIALSSLHRGPLALLCTDAALQPPYTSRDIGFRIAPRINAAGRMADPHIALHALLGDAQALLALDGFNRERQDVINTHMEELIATGQDPDCSMICILGDQYSPGICGLLAGKLCEAHGKPVMVAGGAGSLCTASLRSVPGYDVTAGLGRCRDLLISFGGHAMAAGCSFQRDIFEELRDRLNADAVEMTSGLDLTPSLVAECPIPIGTLTMDFCTALHVLEPFGQGNPEPRFLLENVQMENVRCVGKTAKHLQATVGGRKLIGFGLGHLKDVLNTPVDLLCRVGIDTWQGAMKPQLFLDDVRIADKRSTKLETRNNTEIQIPKI